MKEQQLVHKKVSAFNHSIVEHRKKISTLKPLTEPANIPYKDILIYLKASVCIPVRMYIPRGMNPPYPTIIYIPGTAFVASETAFTDVICTYLAEKSNAVVVNIFHRLAPENKFPKGLNDTYSVFRFIVSSPEFQIDKDKIIIVGYSSGGNFAASIAIQSKKEGFPITRQILISPMTDLSRSLTGCENFEAKDMTITDDFVKWFLNLYLPEGINRKNPWLSPFWQKPKCLQGLPPTDIIFAEYDRFRSDAQGYYDKLTEAGINTSRLIVKGEDHSFLWHKLDIIETIGACIKTAFKPSILRHPSSKNEHQCFFIKLCFKSDDKTSDKLASRVLKSKL